MLRFAAARSNKYAAAVFDVLQGFFSRDRLGSQSPTLHRIFPCSFQKFRTPCRAQIRWLDHLLVSAQFGLADAGRTGASPRVSALTGPVSILSGLIFVDPNGIDC
jgi:hypothetical protein